jgi:flagellar protein FlaG
MNMQVEAITTTSTPTQQLPRAAESVDAGRKELKRGQSDQQSEGSSGKNNVQPEEILNQIKALTDNGMYSVRFEKSKEMDQMVVKIVDPQTDEVIRQIPAEEVVGVRASLDAFRGQIVDMVR